jgi:AcrR family transcriptional regulator
VVQNLDNNGRRELVSDSRAEQILDAAAAEFAARGLMSASLNVVASRAKVSLGQLYHYFPSKGALVRALAERQLDQLNLLLDRLLAKAPGGEAGADFLIDAFAQAILGDRSFAVIHSGMSADAQTSLRDYSDSMAAAQRIRAWFVAGNPSLPEPSAEQMAIILWTVTTTLRSINHSGIDPVPFIAELKRFTRQSIYKA